MNKVIPFLTAIIILLKPFWPIVEYTLNYDYIVENLCENKEKPILKCNGKCYLAKQIAKELEEESEKKPFKTKVFKLKLPIINWFDIQNVSHQNIDYVVHAYKLHYTIKSVLFTSKKLRPPELV